MKIFVAAAYTAKVDYETGEVFAPYRTWLEGILTLLERGGFQVMCALRDDNYRINDGDPAAAFKLDTASIREADAFLALLDGPISAGVQTEIGYAVALGKPVVLAHASQDKLVYINTAIVRANMAREMTLPLDLATLQTFLA